MESMEPSRTCFYSRPSQLLQALEAFFSKLSHTHRPPEPKDTDDFSLTPLPFDFRNHLRSPILLFVLSPFVFDVLSFQNCFVAFIALYAVPVIVRLRYPRFMEMNIIDDLRIKPGACLSIFASTTALLLETHHSEISLAVNFHPEFYNRPLTRLLRTYLFVEMIFNGTSQEKEQTASWLRWTHRHMHGSITEAMRKELNIPERVTSYGYIDELKAWVMSTLTWSTIAFQIRFGRPLSKRALDTIVLENTCAAQRIGVPEDLLAKDYDSFLTLFNTHLDNLSTGNSLTRSIVKNVEHAALTSKMQWITKIWIRLALMIGHDLLPPRVRAVYDLQTVSTWWNRALLKIVMSVLWFVYPILMWLPLRGVICLLLVLEPQLRPVFKTSLDVIHSMDMLSDEPQRPRNLEYSEQGSVPAYLSWLESGKDGLPFLQRVLVEILRAQLGSSMPKITSSCLYGFGLSWIYLPWKLLVLTIDVVYQSCVSIASEWRTQIKENIIYRSEGGAKFPVHVGLVMDGNRRYARNLRKPVIFGHQQGAQTAGNVLEWWLHFMPSILAPSFNTPKSGNLKYLTVWAFSSDNLKRPADEVDGLFRLMCAELRSLALTSIVHLFQIRVRIIGNIEGFPKELLDSIAFLEDATRMYSKLHLQVAVGYGGRDEIVRSVKGALARGEEITEESISQNTFCGKIKIPPVDLIVRTSEHRWVDLSSTESWVNLARFPDDKIFRTSGFFLWDTQAAELHFIDKLWPQITERDWLDALASFSRREIRGGK